MYNKFKIGLCLLLITFSASSSYAQFTFDGQILQRAEFRNGFGRVLGEGEEPAAFIGHRARLQAKYEMERFIFYVSIQDVRTWGNAPQVKATDPFLSVHEAWAETYLNDHWSVKLGRQELNYDNFRFLGNLDWWLQGRAHDFALVKYEKEDMKLHIGAGYNQDGEFLSGNIFNTPNQYKAAQMARFENKWGDFHLSALFWNDGRQYVERNDDDVITEQGIRYRSTLGLPTIKYQFNNTQLSAFYYHQLGTDVWGNNLNAYDVSAQVTQTFDIAPESGRKFRAILGFEMLSGNDDNFGGNTNRAFAPLYGTNHILNGYMDHFYVAGRYENRNGLRDFYAKGRFDFGSNLFMQIDGHAFYSFGNIERFNENAGEMENMDSYLGAEIDYTLGYIFNRAVSLQFGYSQMFATETLAHIQGVENPANFQNWSYLMLIYRPTMKNRFVGLLF